jgi:hypothetical protein
MRWAGHLAHVGSRRSAYKFYAEKRPLGRPRRRYEDNIRIDLREIGWGGVDWMHLAQDMDQ